MSFQPVIPTGGYAGWSFLTRTIDTQKTAHENDPAMQRDLAYFRENISKVASADTLVSDTRLLKVALGAFGLEDDLPNRYFINKVLSDGTLDEGALANKLSDSRYKSLSAAFGFGDFSTPRTQLSDFADEITEAYKTRSFEVAVGEQNENMRLALNLERELPEIAADDSSDDTKWYRVLGSAPLREVFETAFGLPSSFAALDIDKQVEVLRSRSAAALGNDEIAQFSSPESLDEIMRLYLVRSELEGMTASLSPASVALTLLQSG